MSSQAPIRNNFECVTALCGGFYAIQQGAHTVSGFQKEVEVVVLQAGRSTMGKEHLLLRRYINVVKRKKERKMGEMDPFLSWRDQRELRAATLLWCSLSTLFYLLDF